MLFSIEEIQSGKIKIPETDQKLLWDFWKKYSDNGMVVLRADCSKAGELTSQIQQIISK